MAKVTAAIPADLSGVVVDNAEVVRHHVDVTGQGWDEPTPAHPVIAKVYGGTED